MKLRNDKCVFAAEEVEYLGVLINKNGSCINLKRIASTVGVNGGDPSAASKSTRRNRAARGRIVAAGANLGFLDSCPSHLMVTNKKTN
ncbi:hypothetical protein Y032_0005g2593 [Ancylostoma ceylanicum]|uniref:Uncharacterized protein n=1 Tax=Ancylostoma ceylanicum TaxID=53326 RepID=A0A016VSP0_9BILA|nr:hypothetical protein Y032_0005g2593 [Ancylostoma ceylanicum]